MLANWSADVTNDIEVMLPLYPPLGAPCRGYVCCVCKDVTRTKRGMWRHLWHVHAIKKQTKFEFEPKAAIQSVEATQ